MASPQHTSRNKQLQPRKKLSVSVSLWVILGFVLWLGFFIGAIIMHAMVH
jgi:hypothetical protein